jgi:putative heme transporter
MPLRRSWGTTAKAGGTVAVAAGAGWALYRERATLENGFRVLGSHSEVGWVIACFGAQCLSMVFFALLQRGLLRAGGARLTVPGLLSMAYMANAVAVAVPVIGSGMAATYSYQHFRDLQVDPVIAKAALALAGMVSTVTFAVVVVAAALFSGNPAAAASALAGALTCLIILIAVVAALRTATGRSRIERIVARGLCGAQRVFRRPQGDATELARDSMARLGQFTLDPATVGMSFVWGLFNWAADACGLILAVRAIGVPIPWSGILLVWTAGQGAASLSPTPGGIGVVEITMTVALSAAGLRPANALAAVLLYRIVAFKSLVTLVLFIERLVIRRQQRGRLLRESTTAADGDVTST